MLITLMGNIGMFGSVTPPTPVPITSGGHSNYAIDDFELKRAEIKKRILREDTEILGIIKMFLECQ